MILYKWLYYHVYVVTNKRPARNKSIAILLGNLSELIYNLKQWTN